MTKKNKIIVGVCAYLSAWLITALVGPSQIESNYKEWAKRGDLARHDKPVGPDTTFPVASYYLRIYCPCPFILIARTEAFFTEHHGTGGTYLGFWFIKNFGSIRLSAWTLG